MRAGVVFEERLWVGDGPRKTGLLVRGPAGCCDLSSEEVPDSQAFGEQRFTRECRQNLKAWKTASWRSPAISRLGGMLTFVTILTFVTMLTFVTEVPISGSVTREAKDRS
jgi:hypothetical protein